MDKDFIEKSIRQRFLYILETHEPDRAIILTSIVFDIDEQKVREICKEEYRKSQILT